MKQVTVVLWFLFSLQLFALNKNTYDISQPPLNSLAKSSDAQTGYWGSIIVEKDVSAYSMMLGGYFTLGTTDGLSNSPFDNDCQLSYGHPYALTSFPFFSIDGSWRKPDETGLSLTELLPQKNGDIVSLKFTLNNINFSFQLQTDDNGRSVAATMILRNDDTVPHNIGMGLMFDPALGQWGDGHLTMNNQAVIQTKEYDNVPSQILLWERQQQPLGLGLTIGFNDNAPNTLSAANWHDVHAALSPGSTAAISQDIYDLCLKMIWDERVIAANAETAFHITFTLQVPDFSSNMFLRWNMPTALSMEQNILFPSTIRTLVRAMNTTAGSLSNLQLSITYPDEFDGEENSNTFAVNAQSSAFQQFTIQSKERYEDMIVPIKISCKKNGQEIDKLTRNVFIPATPVSDEGLLVSIDSLILNEFPTVSILFSGEIEETGQKLLNLKKENVFVWENQNRITEFSMIKDTTAGATSADIVFVLDVTGSMGDEIEDVRNNIIEFADSLDMRGVDFRLGMVTFLDVIENIYPFTTDVHNFQQLVGQQYAHGGGDGPENSLDALAAAAEFDFRPSATRMVIWITDADYHESDGVCQRTKQQVINLLLANDIKVHSIGNESFKSSFYDPIILATGGDFFNIYGNFRDIFINISRLRSSDKYLLQYRSAEAKPSFTLKLKIHYAGLGGETTITTTGQVSTLAKKLSCYPNPFNPIVNIKVDGFAEVYRQLDIYNMLGQRVRHFELQPHSASQLIWNAFDDFGRPVGSGFYIVKLLAHMPDGHVQQESQKILYLR